MKTALMVAIVSALELGSAAAAQSAQPATSTAAVPQQEAPQSIVINGRKRRFEPNRVVCKDLEQTGSRINVTRVCRTMLEWAAEQRADQQTLSEKQYNGAK
jgi:hypothetical protein